VEEAELARVVGRSLDAVQDSLESLKPTKGVDEVDQKI